MQVSSSCLEWNRQGFFALPDDTYETYSERVRTLQAAKNQGPSLAKECVIQMYDIDPVWVPVEYSAKGLWPWEAGCTWYSDERDIPPTIQLKAHTHYLGIYQKDEILAHEYVHAVRANLASSRFEEIFSYLTSLYFAPRLVCKLRTMLGPLFQAPWEALVLVASLVATLLFLPMLFFTIAIITYLAIRLVKHLREWHGCKKHLDALLKSSSLPLMVRLTDDEIIRFSSMPPEDIRKWINSQSANFRWQLLMHAYCKRE